MPPGCSARTTRTPGTASGSSNRWYVSSSFPDVSVLTDRGQAESTLVSDLLRIAKLVHSPAARTTVARLSAADGVYDDVGYENIQAVYAHNPRLVARLDRARGQPAFAASRA